MASAIANYFHLNPEWQILTSLWKCQSCNAIGYIKHPDVREIHAY